MLSEFRRVLWGANGTGNPDLIAEIHPGPIGNLAETAGSGINRVLVEAPGLIREIHPGPIGNLAETAGSGINRVLVEAPV
jgi:hypothetical protein